MTSFGTSGFAAVLVVALAAFAILASVPAATSSNPHVAAGPMRAAATPIVFGPESPANNSLWGLAHPVVAIAVPYADLAPSSKVVFVDFHLDGMNLTSAGTFNDTLFTLPIGFALRNGLHLANFLLVDNFGTVGYHNWTFTVDTIPPVLVLTSPLYPAVPTSAVPVQGTAFPALAAANPVSVVVTAWPSHLPLQTFTDTTTGAFSVLMPLSEGTNVLFVNATDAAGNMATEVKSIVSDTIKPALTVLTPVNMSVSPTSIVRVAGVSEYGAYLTVNGFVAVVTPNGTWSVQLALPDGVNVIQVAAVDSVGNLNYAIVVVFVDSTTPRITVGSAPPVLTNQSTLQLSGSVNDTKVVALYLRYNQILQPLSFNAVSGSFRATLAGLQDGSYTIEILAVDAAQRTAAWTTVVVVDTTPPVVRLTTPPDGLETNASTVHLVGTVDDPTATVLVNDQVLRPSPSGGWEATVALVPGSNVLRITAADAAGNRASPILLHVTYYSPYPGLANQTAANTNNLEALAGFTRLALVGILLLVLGVVFALYARTGRQLRENRQALATAVRALKSQPRPPVH